MNSNSNAITYYPGWQFVQIPGPSNVPARVLAAMARPTIDHRGDEFAAMAKKLIADVKPVFGTKETVAIFPSSGTGAWEAALVNSMSAGDKVIMTDTGHFSALWHKLALKLGLEAELLEGNWGRAADPFAIYERLKSDYNHAVKAVCVVHNETSTGATSDIGAIRKAIDDAGHPALLMVDTISSLGSIPYRHDEWGVDITIAGSQKGLMLPPGLGFNAFGSKARAAMKGAQLPRSYFDWTAMEDAEVNGQFPYTPATNLLFGLRAALDMLNDEGIQNVFARHIRHGQATRAAVEAWGLEIVCQEPLEQSNVLTAVELPDNFSADAFRRHVMQRFNMPLGNGLAKLRDRVFRIGHLGDFNDLMLAATLSAIQMGLSEFGYPIKASGIDAALKKLSEGRHSNLVNI